MLLATHVHTCTLRPSENLIIAGQNQICTTWTTSAVVANISTRQYTNQSGVVWLRHRCIIPESLASPMVLAGRGVDLHAERRNKHSYKSYDIFFKGVLTDIFNPRKELSFAKGLTNIHLHMS